MSASSSAAEAPAGAANPRGEADDSEVVYLNRELSRLDFYGRVLELAQDETVPLLERVKFLAIFSQFVDEFFQVQVAGLKDQVKAGIASTGPDGRTPAEQLRAIRDRVEDLLATEAKVFLTDVGPRLAEAGVRLCHWESLDEEDRAYLVRAFQQWIFPVLTPLSVDPAHPFPEISNLSLNLAVMVRNAGTGERRFARVKVPPILPRFVVMPDGERFVPLEQVIAAHLPALFRGMEIERQYPFRVTRNADLIVDEDEADDLIVAVEMELRRRRFGKAVRLEVDAQMSDEVRTLLLRELELEPGDLYAIDGPLDLGGLWAVYELDRPDLKDEAWTPMTQPGLATADDEPVDLFAVLSERDVLVHHPYDSFTTSVEAFIKQAANDPRVLAIKQTLYRTSGDSPVVRSLIEAAEAGKQVAVLVEVKARFDEEANIGWARALEEVGVHVVYGVVGLKTHSKTALVVRQEDEGIRRYCHIGTGNYNPRTARLYTDIGLLTSDADIGDDLTELFNFLTGYARHVGYRKLLVAPTYLRGSVIDLIRAETEAPAGLGRIVIKANHLVDPAVIDALYEASQAGVEVDLIVRGICCIRPGVPGLSERIRVRSIVGRYLEHSRIMKFGGSEKRPPRFFIGSADLWQRNLDRRIEVVTPVEDPDLMARLEEVLEVNLADDTQAWELTADGTWERVPTVEGVSTVRSLQEAALGSARRRRDPDSLISFPR
jgi:polyphosphate kinase